MKLVKGFIEGYKGYAVQYLLIRQEEASDRLAVMLPGAGYTSQAPLFHYATDIYLQKGYDVLNVNYRYNDEFYDDFTTEELSEAVRFDVAKNIDQVMAESSYEKFCLIGKSFGTIAMASELQRPLFRDAAAIWLTPLIKRPDVFDAMHTFPNRALSFIGDEDPGYIPERWNQLETNPQMTLRLVPGTEHSLEIPGKILASIDIMKDIMDEIEKF
ncbi:alpha/beta fold hydrolase [Planococcus halotolerans]|uniref:alpha/beta fold hydrolase n=1 Tax=Planococcus halotolerans TaxID=2233542 RepID=UPI001092FA08|nr:alpha/beta hydrolase [Planococcus halotolerans]QHJ69823.1 alpha/beta hydrolase [Planococcus halotolerans]